MMVRRCRHGVVVTASSSRRRVAMDVDGGYTTGRRRVTVALAQWAHIPSRGARAGAALAVSDWEGGHRCLMPVHDGAMGN
jgi:hypothetical protein